MQKRNRKNKIFLALCLIVPLLIFSIISFIIYDEFKDSYITKEEDYKLEIFFQELEDSKESTSNTDNTVKENESLKTENYISVIEIPKISLKRGMYSKDSKLNDVDKNIEILKESDYPDIDGGNFILAGHSGSGRTAYFNDLDKLELEDTINIYYKGYKYIYNVKNIYEIDKTGKAKIVRNKGITTLTLITCKDGTDKQIVIIAELLGKA